MVIYRCDICGKDIVSETFMFKEKIGKEVIDLCAKCSTEFEKRDRDTKKAIFLNMKRENGTDTENL